MAITSYTVTNDNTTAAFTATEDTAVTVMYLCNTEVASGFSTVVDVYVVDSTNVAAHEASPSNNYKIYSQLSIRAGDTYIIDSEKLILNSGDKIYIATPDSTGSIRATISTIGL
jgi:hypothetical protein